MAKRKGSSQSYSCWYWVLSSLVSRASRTIMRRLNPILAGTGFCLTKKNKIRLFIEGLNPILAGTGFCPKLFDDYISGKISLNPILAGTGFCLARELTFRFSDEVSILFLLVLGSVYLKIQIIHITGMVSILFLLVLGSVNNGTFRSELTKNSLNPILAGTGFCRDESFFTQVGAPSLNPILAGTGFCHFYINLPEKSQVKVSILFLLVLGSVKNRLVFQSWSNMSQSYSCWYWVLSSRLTKM